MTQDQKEVRSMDLMPWKSGKEANALSSLRREFNDLFDRFWSGALEPMQFGRWTPAVDISETDEQIVVEAEVPGMEPEQIDVALEGNVLTLKGEKKDVRTDEGQNYHRVERQYGAFVRSIQLPTAVEIDKVSASFKNGVLQVTLPKSEDAKPKRVAIDLDK
jgi:HSP20 family protein